MNHPLRLHCMHYPKMPILIWKNIFVPYSHDISALLCPKVLLFNVDVCISRKLVLLIIIKNICCLENSGQISYVWHNFTNPVCCMTLEINKMTNSKSRMNVFQDWMKLKGHPHSMILDLEVILSRFFRTGIFWGFGAKILFPTFSIHT